MRVSVVVTSYNVGRQLEQLLTCLTLGRLDPADSLEVIVVDDGSTDTTRDVVARFDATLAPEYLFIPRTARSGRVTARNAGIVAATGELVLLLDADQVTCPELVAEHVRFHHYRDNLVVVGLRHDLGDGAHVLTALAEGHAPPPVVRRDGREDVFAEFSENLNNLETCWHHMFTCNVSIRREHLLAVGGFDEDFRGWGLEDCELGYRLRRAGLAFAYNRKAVAYQRHRHVTPGLFTEWRRNLAHFIDRHHGAAEVAVQAIVGRAFDPADRGIDWLESMRRLEFAARALAGRLPGPRAFTWINVDDDNVSEVLAQLPRRASAENLVVVDRTTSAALAGPIQCIDTDREVLYAYRPDAATLAGLRRGAGLDPGLSGHAAR